MNPYANARNITRDLEPSPYAATSKQALQRIINERPKCCMCPMSARICVTGRFNSQPDGYWIDLCVACAFHAIGIMDLKTPPPPQEEDEPLSPHTIVLDGPQMRAEASEPQGPTITPGRF